MPRKFQLDQILNGPLSAIMNFNRSDISDKPCQITRPLSTIKQMYGFRYRNHYAFKTFNLIKFKNADYQKKFHMPVIWQAMLGT